VKKYQFIIAKMAPFLLIGLADLSIGMLLGKILFNVPFEGSIWLLFLGATIFLTAILGLALFISTLSGTQQQFMFIAFFFMIIFVLMSGIFTPYESMPGWAQEFNRVNPVAYLMRINRMVMLKGSTIHDISTELWSLVIIATTFTFFAVRRYRKTAYDPTPQICRFTRLRLKDKSAKISEICGKILRFCKTSILLILKPLQASGQKHRSSFLFYNCPLFRNTHSVPQKI
jgi:hypothetical protein